MVASPCGTALTALVQNTTSTDFDRRQLASGSGRMEKQRETGIHEPDYETVYFHLIGRTEAPRGQYGIRKWETHDEKFNRFPDSDDCNLVEFLKAVQK